MALDKEGRGGIKAVDANFVHEFLGSADKDPRRQLLGTVDFAKAMKDGVFFSENGATVGDRRVGECELEGQVQVGICFRSNLEQVTVQWAAGGDVE